MLGQVPWTGMVGGTLTLGYLWRKKWLLQLTHLPSDLVWFAGTPFQDWGGGGVGVPPPPISLFPSVRSSCFEIPAMLLMLLEWENTVYDFPTDCHKSKAKTPTSRGAGSGPGALVAACAVGGLEERCTTRPSPQRRPGSSLPARPWSLRVLRLSYLQIAEQIISERV